MNDQDRTKQPPSNTHNRYPHINRESITQWMKRNGWIVESSGVGGELWKSTTTPEAEVGVPFGPLDDFSIESISKRLAQWHGVDQSTLLNTLATDPKSPHPNPPIDVHQPSRDMLETPNKWVSSSRNKIWITDSRGRRKSMTSDQATDLAHALLTAANYIKENNAVGHSKKGNIMNPMTPEEAQRWLKEGMETGNVPQIHARRALQTLADMDVETITTEPHPRGSWNGDAASPCYFDVAPETTLRRYVTDWKES